MTQKFMLGEGKKGKNKKQGKRLYALIASLVK